MTRILPLAAVIGAISTATAMPALADTVPAVVVTVENAQPSRGVFLTPPWLGIHDGSFDSYDGGAPASVPLGGDEIERLAEDGDNSAITATFEALLPDAPQVAGLPGPGGPLAPGDRASTVFRVNPLVDRYFSYASMIIPSNDFFIANGNPLAHQLFDDNGEFVGTDFIVGGSETNDAGTEVNDEIASNVAFLAQAAPDVGVTENLPVIAPAPGFAAPGTLTFPNGVLNHPVFANGDFNDADDPIFRVSFRFLDLAGRLNFDSVLSTDQEVTAMAVESEGTGDAQGIARGGEMLRVVVRTQNLTGPVTMAHLHLGQAGVNGPVVVDLGPGIQRSNNRVNLQITEADLVGVLAGRDLETLLGEMAAGNVYVNIHTEANPAGEIRGQLR
ncbi:MAG: spondin domain-containing protein [Pseudomonadota bacterium]